jgi:hypothetical protein
VPQQGVRRATGERPRAERPSAVVNGHHGGGRRAAAVRAHWLCIEKIRFVWATGNPGQARAGRRPGGASRGAAVRVPVARAGATARVNTVVTPRALLNPTQCTSWCQAPQAPATLRTPGQVSCAGVMPFAFGCARPAVRRARERGT